MKLSEQERSQIGKLTMQFEARTGTQVLAVFTGKSDAYPEIPWKAFAIGAALAALALVAVSPNLDLKPLLWCMVVLGAGLALSLASIFLHSVARIFLGSLRAAGEVRQLAQALFLERGLSSTKTRRAVLVLLSQFERRSAIVADTGVLDKIAAADFDRVTATMDSVLSEAAPASALAQGLALLEKLLIERGFSATGAGDEIPGELLQMEAPKP